MGFPLYTDRIISNTLPSRKSFLRFFNFKNAHGYDRLFLMRAKQSSRVPRVLLMMNISISTYRELLQGILRYSSERGHWAVHVIEGRPDE